MELINRRILRISDLIPPDSGVYSREVDVEFDHGIGHAPQGMLTVLGFCSS